MKRNKAKQGTCAKCGKYFYVHKHHIEPQEHHGKDGETALLCPNCHTHIHEYMNEYLKNPEDKEETRNVWEYWLTNVPITWMLLIGLLSALWWLSED